MGGERGLLVMLRLLSAGDALIGTVKGRAGARSACRKRRAASPRHLLAIGFALEIEGLQQ